MEQPVVEADTVGFGGFQNAVLEPTGDTDLYRVLPVVVFSPLWAQRHLAPEG
jgi:hypothetical protein